MDDIEKIEKLNSLKEAGILTEQEFVEQKKMILGNSKEKVEKEQNTFEDRLVKLNDLKSKGILKEEEFNQCKQEILDTLFKEEQKKNITTNYVWFLTFAPLLGAICEQIVAEVVGISYDNLWFITISLNILFSYLDANELKKYGYQSAMIDNAWFVPGYLYERSKLLKEQPIYLGIWLVLFIFMLGV